ncbi:MAG: carbohydrate ABC transporter permease [Brevinema sp.]
MNEKIKQRIITGFQYIALLIFAFLFFVPILWALYSSIRYETAMFSGKIFENPLGLTLAHYQKIFASETQANFDIYILNSIKVAILAVSFVVVIGIMGAYVLSRYRMRAQKALILAFLSSQMFPGVLMTVSIFSFFYKLNIANSTIGLALGHMVGGLPFALWMMKGYIDAIPKELDEAGRLDGLGVGGILFHIILPLAAPGLAVASFYAFMVSWGDYLYASVLINSNSARTLPLALSAFFSSQQVQWGPINAAVIVSLAPTVLLFILLQKQIVEGLASGGVKG